MKDIKNPFDDLLKEDDQNIKIGTLMGKNTEASDDAYQKFLLREKKSPFIEKPVVQESENAHAAPNTDDANALQKQDGEQQVQSSTPDQVYKQLMEKYNIKEEQLAAKKPASEIMRSVRDAFKAPQANDATRKLPKIPQRPKHISEYHVPQQTESVYHQVSPLDKGLPHNQAPQLYQFMEDKPMHIPRIDIGERYSQMMIQSVVRKQEHMRAARRGKGYTWYAARTGKLGVDLYFIAFGIIGFFAIPYWLYRRHKKHSDLWMKQRGISRDIEDFESAGFDLDELSITETNYNQYQDEIIEEQKKTLNIWNEITLLRQLLFANR